jgi:hypothetical protein
MKKRNKPNRLLKNKKITIIIVLSILIGVMIFTYKSPIQRKLIGFWNIEFENSYIERDSIYKVSCSSIIQRKLMGFWNIEFENSYIERDSIYNISWSPVHIKKNIIKLPLLFENTRTFSESEKDATGTWKVISIKPDSIFFNVPKNPLHGKYAIRFFIDEKGWSGMNNIYKIELKNDSTYLICNKGGILFDRDVQDWVDK